MRLDVYQTDGEAFAAAAERAAAVLAEAGAGRLTVALAGGRSGRGVMSALAERTDLPWDRIERSTRRLLTSRPSRRSC